MRPSVDLMLMRIAEAISSRSTCARAQVGAVVARDGRVVSTGYAGAPAGLPHCLDVGCDAGPDGGCRRTVHAEANAIAFAARCGTATNGCVLVTTLEPCLVCARLAVNAGIARVLYRSPYRVHDGLELLGAAGVRVDRIARASS